MDLSETYPTMEAQGVVPELLRKVLNAYDMVKKQQTKKTPQHTQKRVNATAFDTFVRQTNALIIQMCVNVM